MSEADTDTQSQQLTKLLFNISPSQMGQVLQETFAQVIPWLEDPESYYYQTCHFECSACTPSKVSHRAQRACDICHDTGVILKGVKEFEKAVADTGGLAISIGYEHHIEQKDFFAVKIMDKIFEKPPVFIRHLNIDEQFIRYLLVWPASSSKLKFSDIP